MNIARSKSWSGINHTCRGKGECLVGSPLLVGDTLRQSDLLVNWVKRRHDVAEEGVPTANSIQMSAETTLNKK